MSWDLTLFIYFLYLMMVKSDEFQDRNISEFIKFVAKLCQYLSLSSCLLGFRKMLVIANTLEITSYLSFKMLHDMTQYITCSYLLPSHSYLCSFRPPAFICFTLPYLLTPMTYIPAYFFVCLCLLYSITFFARISSKTFRYLNTWKIWDVKTNIFTYRQLVYIFTKT